VNTRVIGRPETAFEQQVIIAAGSSSGIRIDTPVITDDGLVGRVTRVTGSAAQVTLITDEESAVQALDLTSTSGATGLVRHGQGEGSLILDRVPKSQDVREGDLIVTAGTRSRQYPSLYPRGLAIGTVISVGQTDTAAFKQIQIDPFVDFGGLDSVIALVAKRPPPELP
jgi:rod shape-determining protein MreC